MLVTLRCLNLSRSRSRNDLLFHWIWCCWSIGSLSSTHHSSLEIWSRTDVILVRLVILIEHVSLSVCRGKLFICARESWATWLGGSLPLLHIVNASFCHALPRLSAECLGIQLRSAVWLAQLCQVVFSKSHAWAYRRLLCNFGYCLGLELDLLPLIDEYLANWESQSNACLSRCCYTDDFIPYHCKHTLHEVCAAVAYLCNRLKTDRHQFLVDYLERR